MNPFQHRWSPPSLFQPPWRQKTIRSEATCNCAPGESCLLLTEALSDQQLFHQFKKLKGESLKERRLVVAQHLLMNKTEPFALVYRRSIMATFDSCRLGFHFKHKTSDTSSPQPWTPRRQHTLPITMFHSKHLTPFSHILLNKQFWEK